MEGGYADAYRESAEDNPRPRTRLAASRIPGNAGYAASATGIRA